MSKSNKIGISLINASQVYQTEGHNRVYHGGAGLVDHGCTYSWCGEMAYETALYFLSHLDAKAALKLARAYRDIAQDPSRCILLTVIAQPGYYPQCYQIRY